MPVGDAEALVAAPVLPGAVLGLPVAGPSILPRAPMLALIFALHLLHWPLGLHLALLIGLPLLLLLSGCLFFTLFPFLLGPAPLFCGPGRDHWLEAPVRGGLLGVPGLLLFKLLRLLRLSLRSGLRPIGPLRWLRRDRLGLGSLRPSFLPALGLFLALRLFPTRRLLLTLWLFRALRPRLLLLPPGALFAGIVLNVGRRQGFKKQRQDTQIDQSEHVHGYHLPCGRTPRPARSGRD